MNEMNEMDDFFMELACGHMKSLTLKIILDLDIVKQLLDGPKTCLELSQANNVDRHNLYVIMRTFSTMGIFREDEEQDELFYNTDK